MALGFDPGSLSKPKAISLHRAARAACLEAGRPQAILERKEWDAYLARTANVGSRGSAENLTWRLEQMGLLKRHNRGRRLELLESSYGDIIVD